MTRRRQFVSDEDQEQPASYFPDRIPFPPRSYENIPKNNRSRSVTPRGLMIPFILQQDFSKVKGKQQVLFSETSSELFFRHCRLPILTGSIVLGHASPTSWQGWCIFLCTLNNAGKRGTILGGICMILKTSLLK